jgi:DNA primase large subunit
MLRQCATSLKVAGLIPDGVIEFFHLLNSFGRTMALDSTQHLTETSTRDIAWE